jgi:hypothetical protein
MPLGSLSPVGSVWTSKRAVSLHVALIVFVPGCVALTWWQVSRALGGNTLSWVYSFEWPIFAGYAVYMWWKLVHDEADEPGAVETGAEERKSEGSGPDRTAPAASVEASDRGGAGEAGGPAGADEHGDELAEYNRYLAELNASGRQKRW